MSTPDVRVRLSPEGIKEVVAALRGVVKESNDAARKSAGGINLVKDAVAELKRLLPTVGLAAAIAGMISLGKQALDTAEDMGHIANAVGGTTEEVSALNLAFKLNESDQEGLQKTLFKTAQFLGQLRAGSREAAVALSSIGLDKKDIVDLSAPRAFEAIAIALQKIPDPAKRAAAAAAIFSRGAGEVLNAINAVGTEGIDSFKQKAAEFGVLVDSDLADAADRAKDSLDILGLQAKGLATQFVSGLAPAIADAMSVVTEAVTGDGVNGMQYFGRVVGTIVQEVTFFFVALGKTIGATAARIGSFASEAVDVLSALAHGKIQDAITAAERGAAERLAIEKDLQDDLADLGNKLLEGPQRGAKKTNAAPGAEPLPPPDPRLLAAREAAIKAQLDAELKVVQEALKTVDASNKAAYDRGLTSLATYMQQRRDVIVASAGAEIKALEAQRAAAANQLVASKTDPNADQVEQLKLRQQIDSLDQAIHARQLQRARELQDVDADEEAEQIKIGQQRTELDAKLAGLEGNRHAVFLQNLADESRAIRELGAKAGQSTDEIESNVSRLVNARTAQFDFEEVSRRGQAALTQFDRDAEQIRRDQQAGIITQLEGEQRLIELERQRLEQLKELARALLEAAKATNDPQQIEKAQAFSDSVNQIAASYRQATDVQAQFVSGGVEAFQAGLQTLLENAKDIDNLGDAFKSLALTVAQALNKIAAEILAKQFVLALARAFGIGTALPATGAVKGGQIRGMAGGGDVIGPRLNIPGPDKIPILAQEGEFMLRRARVREPGALDFLRAWNSGRFTLAQVMRMRGYAEGGQIGAAAPGVPRPSGTSAAGGDLNLRLVNVLSKDVLTDAMASPEGERVILNIMERNSASLQRFAGTRG